MSPSDGESRNSPLSRSELINEIRNFEIKPTAFLKGNFEKDITPGCPLYDFLITRRAIVFYLNLLRFCLQGTNKNNSRYMHFIDAYRSVNILYYDAMNVLLKDCFEQYKRAKAIEDVGSNAPVCDVYFEHYVDKKFEDSLYQSICVYTEANNSFNRSDNTTGIPGVPYISYFEDIMVFYKMNKLLNG